MPKWKFGLRVALPALVVLVIALTTAWIVLGDMASEVDRIESRSREQSTSAALQAHLTRLAETHGDYAVWDDAVRHVYGTADVTFLDANFKQATRTGILFDAAFILDESDRQLAGFRKGEPAEMDIHQEFGSAIEKLIEKVRRDPKPFDAEAGFLKDGHGDIVAVAVGSILPSTKESSIPPGPTRLLVLAHTLDDAAVARISSDFVLEDLKLHKDAAADSAGLPIVDPLGRAIGALSWASPKSGKEALGRIAPTALLATLLICLTMGFLLVIGYRNLSEVRRREQEALRHASHDGLTNLPNRRALTRTLEAAASTRGGQRPPIAVIYLDLDGFKEVNDAYGHEVGDRVLVKVATAFAGIVGDHGMLARVGGDEFAVVLTDCGRIEKAMDLADKMVALFERPFLVEGRQVQISTSAGVATSTAEPCSADELLRRADVAMYLAKEFGRNRVATYDPSIDAARAERLRLAEDLRAAITDNRLALVYQPIFDAATMRPIGVEALLRWLHPEIGLVPPDKFVPIAEENGLIEPIGEWVLNRACRDAREWPGVKLAVNVSPVQFRNPGFDGLLAKVLADTGFPAERLEIEMTETHLVANPDRAQAIIASLRQIGVTIALDDFGTGYSSIGYLRRFTFDKLKIDRSLVVGITRDMPVRRLCEATITLARSLDLVVTAEGVETEQEAAILRQAGCDQLQGYAFARPMTAEVVGSFLMATLSRPLVVPWHF